MRGNRVQDDKGRAKRFDLRKFEKAAKQSKPVHWRKPEIRRYRAIKDGSFRGTISMPKGGSDRECARRRRQIERGQLKEANGLVR